MKKPAFRFIVCFFVLTVPLFGQAVDKAGYKAVDPFDYKLDEKKAARGAVRKFKSVVQYTSQSGTVLSFASLDEGTSLHVAMTRNFSVPAQGQKVTIYYTATKRIIDSLVLDEIDVANTTEEGISLVKSRVPASTNINKSGYKEIEVFDYKMEAENAPRNDVRKYKSKVLFSSQDGIAYYFVSPVEKTLISMKAEQRIPPLAANQSVTVYYTATKGIVDTLSLDAIEL
jgi:hypothetical protein